MEQMAALSFNQSNAGPGIGRQGHGPPPPPATFALNGFPPPAPFAPNGFGCTNYGGHGGQGQGRGRGCGRGPPAFNAGRAPPITYIMAGRAPGYMGQPPATGGGHYAPLPQAQQVQAPPYSNLMKWYANWNACYSCGFDVADGHTSQMCPQHLRKPDHNCYFTRQNVQQYVNGGYGCSTKSHHKNGFPPDVTVRGDGWQHSV
jgi:hypothetical protein